jgi:hypothetical protein
MKANTEWKQALAKNIMSEIARLRRTGAVAMSARTLRSVVKVPQGGPIGVNAQWAFEQAFDHAVSALPTRYRKFIY